MTKKANKSKRKLGTKWLTFLYIVILIHCFLLPLSIISSCGNLKASITNYEYVIENFSSLRSIWGGIIFWGIVRLITAIIAYRNRNSIYGYRFLITSLSFHAIGIIFSAFTSMIAYSPLPNSSYYYPEYIFYIDTSNITYFIIISAVVLLVLAFNIWYIVRRIPIYDTIWILDNSTKTRCPFCGMYNDSTAQKCSSCKEPLQTQNTTSAKAENKYNTETTSASVSDNSKDKYSCNKTDDQIIRSSESTDIEASSSIDESITTTPSVSKSLFKPLTKKPHRTPTSNKKSAEETQVSEGFPVAIFCRKCGKKLTPDSAFCNYCGTEIIKEVTDDEV